MGRTFDTLGNDTVEVVFDNLGFQAYGNCLDYADRDLNSPHRCCADPIKRSSLLSSKVCMLRKRALCPSYGGLICSLLSGKDAGFQRLDASVIFFMCHALIVTNEAAIAQLGVRLTEVPKVRSSVRACGSCSQFPESTLSKQELLSRSSHWRLHCNVCKQDSGSVRTFVSLSYENSVIRNLFHDCLLGQTLG